MEVRDETCALCGHAARVTYLLWIAHPVDDIQRVWVGTDCSNPVCLYL
jgi:hypothetical protein